MRGRAVVAACAAALAWTAPAWAGWWPVAGGDPSRSGAVRADEGDAPVGVSWVKAGPDARVRTPVVVTGGGGPNVQRVAYGTADGRLHLQLLGTGEPVGAEEGLLIDTGTGPSETGTFGQGANVVGFADTSTADRLGQLLVVHNDQAGVYIARVDLRSGERIEDDVPLSSSLGCTIGSSPLLTPPDPTGGRLLYFVIDGACGAGRGLVRVPITGDAASTSSQLGRATHAPLPAAPGASPALVVLRDPDGRPRFHVAVGREAGVDFFDATVPLSPATPPAAVEPAITARFEMPSEISRTPVAAVAANGLVAGGDGSGTGPAPAIYVAAEGAQNGRVYRFVQDGPSRTLRAERISAPVGVPGPALAVAETVLAAGVAANGMLLVPSESNLTLLRTADLSVAAQLSGEPLPAGRGFRQTVPVVAGPLAYVSRDGSPSSAPEHLVLRLDGLRPLEAPAFAPAVESGGIGTASGQPAIARGWVVFGSPGGAIAYRNRDVTAPVVELAGDPATIGPSTVLSAVAGDARGIESVGFRLLSGGDSIPLGRTARPAAGSPFAGATWQSGVSARGIEDGEYQLEALAMDSFGNTATSAPRRVRVSGLDAGPPSDACERELRGSHRDDRIVGTAASERIMGGRGDDRLDGAGGADCVGGEVGSDVLAGGAGKDLLEGGGGKDVLAGGAGSNRMLAGAGADVLRGGGAIDRLEGGGGRDTLLAGGEADAVEGGGGNDTLRGEAGDDRLHGGGGRDVLAGGGGRNRLSGGGGSDRILAANGRRDRIRCGPGRDRVVADRADRVARDCEHVRRR